MTYREYLNSDDGLIKDLSSSFFENLKRQGFFEDSSIQMYEPYSHLRFLMDAGDLTEDDEIFIYDSEAYIKDLPESDSEDEKTELDKKIEKKEDLLPSELRIYWGSFFPCNTGFALHLLDEFLLINISEFADYDSFIRELKNRYYLLLGLVYSIDLISDNYKVCGYLSDQLYRIFSEIRKFSKEAYFYTLET